MSEQSSISSNNQEQTDTTNNNGNSSAPPTPVSPEPPTSVSPTPPPPSSQTFNLTPDFMETYECAKLNTSWNKVSNSLAIHPEWLTRIPPGRRWTMLHQIVFSGNVNHLNQVLALQVANPEFRLLCKTLDEKTIRDVAIDRAHIYPAMIQRIERLVAVDQLLNNAKENKWELVKQTLTLQPHLVNERPPYRRYYLAHYLASVGQLDIFKELSTICHFKLDLPVENKTISQIAREHNHITFAEYIENLSTESNQTTTSHPTSEHHHSLMSADESCISFMPITSNAGTMFTLMNHLTSSHPDQFPMSIGINDSPFATHSLFHGGHLPPMEILTMSTEEEHDDDDDDDDDKKSAHVKSYKSSISDEEQAAYEQAIMNNITKMSQENLLNSITCCITKAILHDPVVAADGFTYEREAILNWFETSNRSPMTNQELDSLELKPNHAIKSILELLQTPKASSIPPKQA